MTLRPLLHVESARPTQDGDGVKIRRIAGFTQHKMDPFLMLDELKADEAKDYIGGFPPHPHRGIETLTYMLQGHFRHQDHMGNVGELRDGGAQWMSAGRGVIHSELPISTEGQLHGFQLWINLPAAKKMQAPAYRDFQPESVPEVALGDVLSARVISGELAGTHGPLRDPAVPILVADLRGSGSVTLPVTSDFKVMAYLYRGQVRCGNQVIDAGQMLFFGEGDQLALEGEGMGLLLMAGRPIGEPVVHWGPFVMNTQAEIEQAVRDYQSGTLTD
ncbi:pirin family protein [Ferrimonas gelatinilytica]|uniref:Pirin family protein n=1 Tax=Ferrimonas gelatinilytica TaxID=1255257 RepID=A0ABP9RUS5_9GAMM